MKPGIEAWFVSRHLEQHIASSFTQIKAVVSRNAGVYTLAGKGSAEPRSQLGGTTPGAAFGAADMDGDVLFSLLQQFLRYYAPQTPPVVLDENNSVK